MKNLCLPLLLLANISFAQCYQTVGTNGPSIIALQDDGSLWSWGLNSLGVLGLGSSSFSSIFPPTRIGVSTDWSLNYAVGTSHVLAIKNDGSLWAWGKNIHGECGNGTSGIQNFIFTPQQIGSATWIAVASGSDHSLGVKTNGTLWAWGYNDFGQLGNGNEDDPAQLVPLQIGTDANWAKVFTFGSTSFAIKTDGTLWSWGNDAINTILGYNGTQLERRLPHQVGNAAGWVSIAPYLSTVMAVKNDGTLWVWGKNTEESFIAYYGNGEVDANNYANNPTQIGIDSDWQSVTTGQYEFKALKSNGTIWGWGRNYNGALGDGTNIARYVPVQVGADSNWTHLSACSTNAVAVNTDHSLYHWGFLHGVGTLNVPVLKGTACPVMGTDAFSSENAVIVSPNPTQGKTAIHLAYKLHSEVEIAVSDMLGKFLLRRNCTIGADQKIQLDFSGYASGLYLVTIQNEQYYYQTKIYKI